MTGKYNIKPFVTAANLIHNFSFLNIPNDRIINVAIEDDDLIKEVTSLPRTEKNCGMITVGMKRKLDMKNYHKLGLIRPYKIYEALLYLKENHPEYSNINIVDCNDWD